MSPHIRPFIYGGPFKEPTHHHSGAACLNWPCAMDTKTSVIKNVHGIIEDHQRRLFLDLASYVDQQLSKHLTERGTRSEKRTRFDSDDVVVRDEVCDGGGFRMSNLGMFFDFLPPKTHSEHHSLKL